MPKRMQVYSVRTTLGVAKEMARYEGATIISKELVESKGAKMAARFPDVDPDQFNIYFIKIESPFCNGARWNSFGVTPKLGG